MTGQLFPLRRALPVDLCEHCAELVGRVWLVPGDVLNSCAACYESATGRVPVHEQGHSRSTDPRDQQPAAWYRQADGPRPA